MTTRIVGDATDVDFDTILAPFAVCTRAGMVVAATAHGRELLAQVAGVDALPGALPESLWNTLEGAASGDAVEWRSADAPNIVLGCTRYRAGADFLLLMNEITGKNVARSRLLHQQRLETTGRLVASIAHELRNAVASIVYNADFLTLAATDLPADALRSTAREMVASSRRLQFTVDGLLDYAQLGPAVSVPVSLRDVLARAQNFLRSIYGKHDHTLRLDIQPTASWVRGNPLVIEQIFINLLMNATEAADGPVTVTITSRMAPPDSSGASDHVVVSVIDDGSGVPAKLRNSIFDPFFTTRPNATGLGLTSAREAAISLGGILMLEKTKRGACFTLTLRRGDNA